MEKENTAQPGIYSENTLVLIICGIQNKRANSFAAILAAKHKYGLGLERDANQGPVSRKSRDYSGGFRETS